MSSWSVLRKHQHLLPLLHYNIYIMEIKSQQFDIKLIICQVQTFMENVYKFVEQNKVSRLICKEYVENRCQ